MCDCQRWGVGARLEAGSQKVRTPSFMTSDYRTMTILYTAVQQVRELLREQILKVLSMGTRTLFRVS